MSWQEFLPGKHKRQDVATFALHLMENISNLHCDLVNKSYKHGGYTAFKINDPKPRDIHKASVRDRLLHHAVYRILYPYFDRMFIFDSYSCRIDKGTYKAMDRFISFSRRASCNHTKTVWVLKCDIRKFFANIDHTILKGILAKHIGNEDTIMLLTDIIDSFLPDERFNVGLPLGSLTSQLLINIYMNEFDHFLKRKLKVKYYIRYADDFVVLSGDKAYLEDLIPKIDRFLREELRLHLHPNKLYIKTLASGVDFLGWVHFPNHGVIRSSTKKRMYRRMAESPINETYQSYKGLLSHGNGYKASLALDDIFEGRSEKLNS